MLVDFTGRVINKPFKVKTPFCDEMITLEDGSLAWSHVNDDTSLL